MLTKPVEDKLINKLQVESIAAEEGVKTPLLNLVGFVIV